MLVELHCHSTRSDGSKSPAEVATMARQRKVDLFCLTDHDTTSGFDEVAQAWPDGPCIRGLELSCRHRGQTVHLLLYDRVRDPERWKLIDERLLAIAQSRRQRVIQICELLTAQGLSVDGAEIVGGTGSSTVGRPHVARALVAAGFVPTVQQAFTHYLHDGSRFDVPLDRFSVEDGLALAEQGGAVASLAHPHSLGNGAAPLVEEFASRGLGGIEVHYQVYKPQQRKHWAELADRFGLVATGGSDFHGDALPKVKQVGIGVPAPHGERILEWLEL
jgi:hypothetical protein